MLRMPAIQIAVGLSAFSLAGLLLYIHYKNKDDDEDEFNLSINPKSSKTSILNNKDISMQFVLTNDKVPLIIGRSGNNIKMIENKTNTVIRFREKDDYNQYCEIIGLQDSVQMAKEMICKELNRSTTIKHEIFIPQAICGKIIGRCGESLQEICRISLAKVSVDSGDRGSNSNNNNNSNSIKNTKRRVVITGTMNQVNIAKKLIENKIQEDENCRKSIEETELKREPRRSPTISGSSLSSSLTSLEPAIAIPSREKFNITEPSNQLIDVYVSALATPEKFWLQLIGPQTKKLDELVNTMTRYYNDEENRELHKIADPYLGQIVTALFKYDGKWYRAEIVGILPNEYNPRDVVLDLYFVDYGDSEYVAPHEVFELRTDFLTLRFQAIECYLANVKPTMTTDTDMWDSTTIAKFEELTHVASWKKLKSRIVTYKERPRGGNHIRREGSPVPGVELFDNIDGTDVNIAHMLISHGYAMLESPEINDVLRLGGGQYSSNFQLTDNNQIADLDKTIENCPIIDDDDNEHDASSSSLEDEEEVNHKTKFVVPSSEDKLLNNGTNINHNNNNNNNQQHSSLHKTQTENFIDVEIDNSFQPIHNPKNLKNEPSWSHSIS